MTYPSVAAMEAHRAQQRRWADALLTACCLVAAVGAWYCALALWSE